MLRWAGSEGLEGFARCEELAEVKETQPDVWKIFAGQPNFDDRMEHEAGFDPGNGVWGGNIRFRLIVFWDRLYEKPGKRSLFGGGAGGAKRQRQPAEDDDAVKAKKPRRSSR